MTRVDSLKSISERLLALRRLADAECAVFGEPKASTVMMANQLLARAEAFIAIDDAIQKSKATS